MKASITPRPLSPFWFPARLLHYTLIMQRIILTIGIKYYLHKRTKLLYNSQAILKVFGYLSKYFTFPILNSAKGAHFC